MTDVNPRQPLPLAPETPHRDVPPKKEGISVNENIAKEAGKTTRDLARHGSAPVILAIAVLVGAGGFVWSLIKDGPPTITPARDVWTATDQLRFEAQNNTRADKQDRMLDKMDALLVAQAGIVNRLITLTERQDERIRALEVWRDGVRTAAPGR